MPPFGVWGFTVGWFFRRSVKVGPLRINFSKSGIGYSFGMRGLRVGRGPRGPYVSGGRYGFYFRQSLKKPDSEGAQHSPRLPISTSTLTQPLYCTNCGAPLIRGNQFCIECGSKCEILPHSSDLNKPRLVGLLTVIGLTAAVFLILIATALLTSGR